MQNSIDGLYTKVIIRIDHIINQQINAIIHHRLFQRLEASWLSLLNLSAEIGAVQNDSIKIKVLALSWTECAQDLTINNADFDASALFKQVYTAEFDQPGGEPYSILIADYDFHHQMEQDFDSISVLAELSKVAASAFSPLITSASAQLVDLAHWGELKPYIQLDQTINDKQHQRWQHMRNSVESQFVALVAPKILIRTAYQLDQRQRRNAFFEEQVTQHEDLLWANSAYRYASAIIKSFAECGWFLHIRNPLPAPSSYTIAPSTADFTFNIGKAQTECYITEQLEQHLNAIGLITARHFKISHQLAFYAQSTLHQPHFYNNIKVDQNAYMSAQMPYLLCASRFAQTIKMILRDKVGSYTSAEDCQTQLQQWLLTYCSSADSPTTDHLIRYPLNGANVEIKSMPYQPGHYQCIIQIKPHCMLAAIDTSLKLISSVQLQTVVGAS